MSKIKFEIKNRWTGSVLFEYEKEDNTLKDTVEQAVRARADLSEADLSRADLSRADLSRADLSGANLLGAYIYVSDNEIEESVIKDFEEKNGIKITKTDINRNIVPTRWSYFWKYGLIICDWEIKEKEEQLEETKEIEEYKTKYTERCIDIEVRNKINELVRAVNKLNKESEEK